MKVQLLDHQHNALDLLIYAKATRLQGQRSLDEVSRMPCHEKLNELEYMKRTIQSGFEFVRYIFQISDVSRAFTHQLVRTRHASYAQEAQRAVDVRDHGWITPPGSDCHPYEYLMRRSVETYGDLIDMGMDRQDARNVLPTGLHTSIMMAVDLRTLMHMAEMRLCVRTQGEYQRVFKMMKGCVTGVHPWAEDLIAVHCVKHGTCCFPNFKHCPVSTQLPVLTYHTDSSLNNEVKSIWEATEYEEGPVAENGRTR